MVPAFGRDHNLPPGVHHVTLEEIEKRFAWNSHRVRLLRGLKEALTQFSLAGCRRIYLDGSFVTDEDFPNDYDVCFELLGLDPMYLDPIFLNSRGRIAQKSIYGGEFFPTSAGAAPGYNFLQFFQLDKQTGNAKGILALDLRERP
jgi:hypothetical protein